MLEPPTRPLRDIEAFNKISPPTLNPQKRHLPSYQLGRASEYLSKTIGMLYTYVDDIPRHRHDDLQRQYNSLQDARKELVEMGRDMKLQDARLFKHQARDLTTLAKATSLDAVNNKVWAIKESRPMSLHGVLGRGFSEEPAQMDTGFSDPQAMPENPFDPDASMPPSRVFSIL
ncbi:hypothetical protein B0H21DRAFT_746332, partial [Amylocystis lapponica]